MLKAGGSTDTNDAVAQCKLQDSPDVLLTKFELEWNEALRSYSSYGDMPEVLARFAPNDPELPDASSASCFIPKVSNRS